MFSTTYRHLQTLIQVLETAITVTGDDFALQFYICGRTDIYADNEWCVVGDELSIVVHTSSGDICVSFNWEPQYIATNLEQKIPLAEICEVCLESGKFPGEHAETFLKTVIQLCQSRQVNIPITISGDDEGTNLAKPLMN